MTTGRDIFGPLTDLSRRSGLAFVACCGMSGSVAAANAVPVPHVAAGRAQDASAQRSAVAPSADPDLGARNAVARARMLECGHQWSSMKRAGTAAGIWKDFSRGCLAQH